MVLHMSNIMINIITTEKSFNRELYIITIPIPPHIQTTRESLSNLERVNMDDYYIECIKIIIIVDIINNIGTE